MIGCIHYKLCRMTQIAVAVTSHSALSSDEVRSHETRSDGVAALCSYFALVGLRSIVMSMSVSLSVRTHNSKTEQSNFTKWLWLGPPLTALRYVMCFRFYG